MVAEAFLKCGVDIIFILMAVSQRSLMCCALCSSHRASPMLSAPGSALPQGLCMDCALCLRCSPSTFPHGCLFLPL
jgi:hypothetical protein